MGMRACGTGWQVGCCSTAGRSCREAGRSTQAHSQGMRDVSGQRRRVAGGRPVANPRQRQGRSRPRRSFHSQFDSALDAGQPPPLLLCLSNPVVKLDRCGIFICKFANLCPVLTPTTCRGRWWGCCSPVASPPGALAHNLAHLLAEVLQSRKQDRSKGPCGAREQGRGRLDSLRFASSSRRRGAPRDRKEGARKECVRVAENGRRI